MTIPVGGVKMLKLCSWPPVLVAVAVGASAFARQPGRQENSLGGGGPATAQSTGAKSPAPGVDWGSDILVNRIPLGCSLRKLSCDSDTSGDIYVTALADSATSADIVFVWRSSDGGQTWTQLYRTDVDSASGSVADCEIIIGHDAGGPWVYEFMLLENAGSGSGLWLLRLRPSMADSAWIPIVTGADTLLSIAADRNIESPECLFVTWGTLGGLVGAAASNDSGQTWVNFRQVFTQSQRPSVCAGGDGCVYVASGRSDSSCIAVARYTRNLGDTTPVITRLDSSGTTRVWNASVAASRELPCSLQVGTLMYCRRDEQGRVSPRLAWTTDGAASWGTAIWPAVNQPRTTWDAHWPNVRRSYGDGLFRGVVTMHEAQTSWDTIVYAVAEDANPSLWEQRRVINDSSATSAFGAQTGWSPAVAGGYVIYSPGGLRSTFFDAFNVVGLEAERLLPPKASRVRVEFAVGSAPVLRLSLARRMNVQVSLFDITGRHMTDACNRDFSAGDVRLLLPTSGLAGGIYLCRVSTPCWTDWSRFVLLK